MVKVLNGGYIYSKGEFVKSDNKSNFNKTIAYKILNSHNLKGDILEKNQALNIKFDVITSHDITYVGIIQTAKAIGLERFPIPYILTNCHNSLCAVGGTINEDDHSFGLSAAKKYGGIYVPAHVAVIHSYIRENYAGCGKMILGSDSHTRYGALGTLGIGEGGPELVKQIIEETYDINMPEVIAIHLKNAPRKGVGPQDVAIALITEVFSIGFVKNKILEFVGDGIKNLSVEYRNGIDVMTTETACLTSIWETDEKVEKYLEKHGRKNEYAKLVAEDGAYYDGVVEIDLAKIEPMIAMPFHPSNGIKISELLKNPKEILSKFEKQGQEKFGKNYTLLDKLTPNGIKVDQAIIAGCAGGIYDNIVEASKIIKGSNVGTLPFSVYPGSLAVYYDLMKKGVFSSIIEAGGVVKTSFCGPCFGAGDIPQNNGFSIRHVTRNFENREGAKPNENQVASVALMDARSIAATVKNGGYLTSALEIDYDNTVPEFEYNSKIYENKVYNGYKNPKADMSLFYGPNITDWPSIEKLEKEQIFVIASSLKDKVTTTDELIPSGETSSYRSNPLKLAEFTLSRRDPDYVNRAKNIEKNKQDYINLVEKKLNVKVENVNVTSSIYANLPGDGSAREQAASCQRVLGGGANFAINYATKRYRSNLINWGIIPFIVENDNFEVGDIIYVENIFELLDTLKTKAVLIRNSNLHKINLRIDNLTNKEKEIIKSGCLINFQRKERKDKKNDL
ncbi:MAG TPA: hydratase [Clostridiales bacterium]|nr:hydratase [Clostridiales bacterium]